MVVVQILPRPFDFPEFQAGKLGDVAANGAGLLPTEQERCLTDRNMNKHKLSLNQTLRSTPKLGLAAILDAEATCDSLPSDAVSVHLVDLHVHLASTL